MTTYARVADGLVAEIIAVPEGLGIADMFHPDLLGTFRPLDDAEAAQVRPGWTFDGTLFAAPPAPAALVPASVTRAQALDVMAGTILPDGRALDTALEQDLQADLDALADQPDSDAAKIEAKRALVWFRNAQTFERNHQRLLDAAARYQLSEARVDALFQAAAAVA